MIEYRNLRVALLGCGSVGTQVARLMREHGDELAQRVGARLELVGIAVRDADAPRDPSVPRELLTADAESLILGADIVIELMGGIEPARTHILAAISSGADVVTANKALLATHGPELFEAAEQVGAQLYYEAAVAGAIPIIRPLRDSLAGDRVERILGIVNGTSAGYTTGSASTRPSRRPPSSATRRRIPPPTSRATTRRRRRPSSRASRSTRACRSRPCTARASRACRPRSSSRRARPAT
jgi:hypothetical protein